MRTERNSRGDLKLLLLPVDLKSPCHCETTNYPFDSHAACWQLRPDFRCPNECSRSRISRRWRDPVRFPDTSHPAAAQSASLPIDDVPCTTGRIELTFHGCSVQDTSPVLLGFSFEGTTLAFAQPSAGHRAADCRHIVAGDRLDAHSVPN